VAAATALLRPMSLGVRVSGRPAHGAWRRRELGLSLLLGAAPARSQEAAATPVRFESLDGNGDGVVDRMEMMYFVRDTMSKAGEEEKSVREYVYGEVAALYDASDIDGDGVLSELEVEFAERIYLLGREQDFGLTWAAVMHKSLDTDGDGFVARAEFENFARAALEGDQVAVDSREIFAKADVDGDGGLSVAECHFAALLFVDLEKRHATSALHQAFEAVDKNSDRRVSKDEIAKAAHDSRLAGLPETELLQSGMQHFDTADADGDGHLDEFETRDLVELVLEPFF